MRNIAKIVNVINDALKCGAIVTIDVVKSNGDFLNPEVVTFRVLNAKLAFDWITITKYDNRNMNIDINHISNIDIKFNQTTVY